MILKKIILILMVSFSIIGCAKRNDPQTRQMIAIKNSYREGKIDRYEYEAMKQRIRHIDTRLTDHQE